VSDERVVPIDVSRVPGDRVRIRLRPAAGFWAFNSFAVDYGDLRPLHVTKVAAIGALRASDGEYLVMTEQGQQTPVTFAAPPRAPGLERTVFLHSRGYYHVNLPADGEPDLGTYQQILQTPGAGAAFSAALYAQFKQTQ
jgi:hypothetical protein